jgi:hypothetical protein
MSRVYGMDDCPLDVKTPEFSHSYHDPASNFTVEFGVGEYAHKTSCESYVDLNADLGGGYDMEVAVKIDGQWHVVEASAVRVKILGSFERDGFKLALQQTGLMTLPFYGKMKTAQEQQEEWDKQYALREQT